ncbi:tRNA uridine-5-carboxymethylaminomethyl(34) synthesis GTPase MnmE [Pseudobutyrivibrio sp. MD2005]|uniref:tRNA uridine-5-carboxymethylaminomethyl(34) synthesis GTPase MnmE n=1 Tax=Pseudobutyrivibrio sp. MD2005 TaxID=1410616 RepID=UPI0004802D46|nr:tRNA uridine-5-carboxymethylaminomethyl(34) synthesis GTPase MnmE [Pseudobutyrivibrio sp. MD2005]
MNHSDTICAIATSLNSSGIGIIRVSGEKSISIVDSIFRGKNKLVDCDTHTIQYGHIYDNENIVDEVLVMIMKAPRSYTTEDVIEIDCHGGILVLKKVLSLLVNAGARIAEPGEFTKRAFLNGRIDLSEAESIMDLISSNSELSMKNSIKQLSGSLNKIIVNLRDKILYETAYIESALDDPEHYDLTGYPNELDKKVNEMISSIDDLINSFNSGHILKEGINTLILGKPNAGKSSLLNTLSRRERAIVTDIPGTTRDTLEEQITINGISLNIIDTAGIRQTDDIVEKIGVDKAIDSIDDADLILFVLDSSRPIDSDDEFIINKIMDKKVIILLNKSDLVSVISEEDVYKKYNKNVISFSSVSLDGLKKLESTITDMFFSGDVHSDDTLYITNSRQAACLTNAKNSLNNVLVSIENMMPEDFFSIDLMDAYNYLGEITGETIDDDLANKIFSEFCMGK